MTHFRKRFDTQTLAEINELIIRNASIQEDNNPDHHGDASDDTACPSHKGKLLIDVTCTSADVAYPTDLNLLNTARKKKSKLIRTKLTESQSKASLVKANESSASHA